MLSMKVFLLQYEAQSSGFVQVCEPVEMSNKWRSGLSIIVKPFTFITFVPAKFFVSNTNSTNVYKYDKI